jgi:molybdopterin/thiamine biosynthesis adenylyltransferase
MLSTVGEYFQLFSAQRDVLTRTQQLRLRNSTVHVAGLGGIGFHVAMFLSEIGVGAITANDPQKIEIDNLNRIPFASITNIGNSKAQLIAHLLRQRPHRVAVVQAKSEEARARALQRSADLLICCSNTYSSRIACVRTAIHTRKPLIDVGLCDARRGFVAGLRVFDPVKRSDACPICAIGEPLPKNANDRIFGTLAGIAGAIAVHLAMRRLIGARSSADSPNFLQLNLGTLTITTMRVLTNPRCPICRHR